MTLCFVLYNINLYICTMKLPINKIIQKKVYNHYDFEPHTPKMMLRDKWKRKSKCKNRQIRRLINRTLDKID